MANLQLNLYLKPAEPPKKKGAKDNVEVVPDQSIIDQLMEETLQSASSSSKVQEVSNLQHSESDFLRNDSENDRSNQYAHGRTSSQPKQKKELSA